MCCTSFKGFKIPLRCSLFDILKFEGQLCCSFNSHLGHENCVFITVKMETLCSRFYAVISGTSGDINMNKQYFRKELWNEKIQFWMSNLKSVLLLSQLYVT